MLYINIMYTYIYIYVHIFHILSPWSPTLRLQFSPRSSPRRARRCIQGKNGTEKTPRTWEICGNLWKSHGKSVKYGKITRDSLVFAVLPRFYMILATKIWGGSCNSYNQEADSCLGLWIGSEWVDSVRTFPRLGMIQMTGVQVALFILVDRCELVFRVTLRD